MIDLNRFLERDGFEKDRLIFAMVGIAEVGLFVGYILGRLAKRS